MEVRVGLFFDRDSRRVAIAITADGRRVHVPVRDRDLVDVSLLGLIRALALSLIGIITGGRRGAGGPR
jgi:hypothetical protein